MVSEKKFYLLKRTFPVSEYERWCDAYTYIKNNTTTTERIQLGIDLKILPKTIKPEEEYIYQVAKHGKEFLVMSMTKKNWEIVRKQIFKLDDE